MKAIKNVKLLGNDLVMLNKAVIYSNKIIDLIDESELNKYSLDEIIDGKGLYLSPGFIDVHVHGCSSYDTMDHDKDNIEIISRNLAKTGVTAFLPTTITMDFSQIEEALEKIKMLMGSHDAIAAPGAQILGAHLEGPFISKTFKGAHDENYILPPDFELIKKYKDVIKIVTLAPELEGSHEFINQCKKGNIVISVGHTAGEFEQIMTAIELGASHFTHTFNAMTPLKHREPGAIGAAMLSDTTCEVIADNIHVHPAVQKLLIKTKGTDNIVLVSDAMRACLMASGSYDLGGQEVFVNNGEARLKDGTLAGSVLTLNTALKNIIENTGLPLTKAIKMITINPARVLGISSSKGTIEASKDADFVIFDEKYNIHYTISNGKTVYRS